MLLTVSRLLLWMPQRNYLVHAKIKDHQLIVTELIHQRVVVHTMM